MIISIIEKYNMPTEHTQNSVLGILFHKKNIPNTDTVLSLISKTVLGILFHDHDGIFY